jgi:hypothetical protein
MCSTVSFGLWIEFGSTVNPIVEFSSNQYIQFFFIIITYFKIS